MVKPHVVDCPICGTNVAIYGKSINVLKNEKTGRVIEVVKCQRCGQRVTIVIKE